MKSLVQYINEAKAKMHPDYEEICDNMSLMASETLPNIFDKMSELGINKYEISKIPALVKDNKDVNKIIKDIKIKSIKDKEGGYYKTPVKFEIKCYRDNDQIFTIKFDGRGEELMRPNQWEHRDFRRAMNASVSLWIMVSDNHKEYYKCWGKGEDGYDHSYDGRHFMSIVEFEYKKDEAEYKDEKGRQYKKINWKSGHTDVNKQIKSINNAIIAGFDKMIEKNK